MHRKDILKITKELIELQSRYAFEARKIITLERLENFQKLFPTKLEELDYEEKMLREPLVEHVGDLPIIATFLHQFIEHKEVVNLGRSLIMLSIHDIGETVLGDVFTFDKTKIQETDEYDAALKLLPDYLQKYYEEYEKRESSDAKYAKAVDSISPLLHEMVLPELTYLRFEKFDFNTQKIFDKKINDFEWDNVLLEIFKLLIEEYKKIEIGEKTIFV
ncbi:HD domain-containing protein [Candidatus Dojkabacteria bacterium]|nr:HD domain-containing protein [Candidatus Dojkabacteria bacterium]